MIKKNLALLLFISFAASALAADNGIAIAKLDQNASRPLDKRAFLPSVTEAYEYYEIQGNTEKDLRCQMNENGCRWDDGRKYDSVTKWHVKWNYDYDRTPDSCTANSFAATVEVTYRYPKWVHPDHARQALDDKWDRYLQNLVMHEEGHRDRAVVAVAELAQAVAKLPPAATCADIDRSVQTLSREYMKKLNHEQKAYDTATVHGVKQGAVFP